jgi:hypothetical protein
MLTVTLVLPGCATIPVVTGLGWELLQVTVSPVVGVSVGVQAARAGSTAQESAAVANAKAEAVEHKRARSRGDAVTTSRGAGQSGDEGNRIIDVSRFGIRAPAMAHG